MRKSAPILGLAAAALMLPSPIGATPTAAPGAARVNGLVLFHALSLPNGGGYKWKGTGVPQAIRHHGDKLVLHGRTGGEGQPGLSKTEGGVVTGHQLFTWE